MNPIDDLGTSFNAPITVEHAVRHSKKLQVLRNLVPVVRVRRSTVRYGSIVQCQNLRVHCFLTTTILWMSRSSHFIIFLLLYLSRIEPMASLRSKIQTALAACRRTSTRTRTSTYQPGTSRYGTYFVLLIDGMVPYCEPNTRRSHRSRKSL